MNAKILVLDAMGVIYKHCDDVEKLLIPFLKSNKSNISRNMIKGFYRRASLGQISSKSFWEYLEVNKNLENEYLKNFELTEELIPFLEKSKAVFDKVLCLSNDVSEWSKKLRSNFKLIDYFDDWFISGDLKCRKPSLEIYYKLLSKQKEISPKEIIFIDDKEENLIPAKDIGFQVFLFTGNYSQNENYKKVRSDIPEIDILDSLFSMFW
jgi:HAD superfamily hydrolase (TIGR01509 family)